MGTLDGPWQTITQPAPPFTEPFKRPPLVTSSGDCFLGRKCACRGPRTKEGNTLMNQTR